ncbi:MAG: RNA polymerase factor sigma-54 [Treponema sp.]|jgi:RNA polymerase sigma-54 factor|nr:RNA polymerase factor sigma-54 [Treponema sp.]
MLAQTLIQRQDLRLTTQLVAAINLMEVPVLALEERIAEELERNPALEIQEEPAHISFEDAPPTREEAVYFEATSDPGFSYENGEESSDRQFKFIEGALTRTESLQEHLLWQLQAESLDAKTRSLCETLIQNLDENGFHLVSVDELLKDEDRGCVQNAVHIVQSLDPVGTCTANYEESLRTQIRLLPGAPEGAEEALGYLGLLQKGKFAEAAKKMNRAEDEARAFFACIKELNPFPGRLFSLKETRFIVPDIKVIKKEGEFIIILNDEEIPVLGINRFFMKIAEEKSGKAARSFAKENIREAQWFINAINERNRTLLKVSKAIVNHQTQFFEKGPGNLVPLTQQTIAGELEIHESTVSRIANGKYMQTEWGLFSMKYFFTNSINRYGGEISQISKESVKAKIKEIILNDKRRLSDQRIADKLGEQGIKVARRTVAKYRHELDMGSSFTR